MTTSDQTRPLSLRLRNCGLALAVGLMASQMLACVAEDDDAFEDDFRGAYGVEEAMFAPSNFVVNGSFGEPGAPDPSGWGTWQGTQSDWGQTPGCGSINGDTAYEPPLGAPCILYQWIDLADLGENPQGEAMHFDATLTPTSENASYKIRVAFKQDGEFGNVHLGKYVLMNSNSELEELVIPADAWPEQTVDKLLLRFELVDTTVDDVFLGVDSSELAECASDESVTVTYGGGASPVEVDIDEVIPGYCMRLNYGGGALWTTLDNAGGLSCEGSELTGDYDTVNTTFNAFRMKNHAPAACGPAVECPDTPPPSPGDSVYIYYGTTIDMATVPLINNNDGCYKVSYSGNNMWFPESALDYRCDILGNPVALDYNQRMYSSCSG